jgi:GT2 family glycosyltransferase
MRVSIIIPSWNTVTLLRQCLLSLETHSAAVAQEIIVVDNASTDGSADMVAREFPSVHLIRNQKNNGYAGGNNQGAAVAQGKYLLLLGSDTEVRAGTIDALVAFLDVHPEAGAVTCRLEFPDGRLQPSVKRFPTVLNAVAMYTSLHRFNQRYLMSDFSHTQLLEVDQPDGTCFMLRCSFFEQHGLFDERLSILYNDVDLCRRMKQAGYTIYFLPSVSVMHHGSSSTRQAPPHLRIEMYRNILTYYERYHGRAARWLLSPILWVRLLAITKDISAPLKLLRKRSA